VKLIDLTGRRFGRLTVVERAPEPMYGKHVAWTCKCDCGGAVTTAGLSLKRGAVNSCGCIRRNDHAFITYEAAHIRVKQAKGPASAHQCIDCGGLAHQWSYDYTAPVEYVCHRRYVLYSLDPARYHPRCRRCHKQHDMNRSRRALTALNNDANENTNTPTS
jgi:hypothetical protein